MLSHYSIISPPLVHAARERKEEDMKAMTTIAIIAAATATASAGIELTNNGGFELGDTSGWDSFPTANSTFNLTSDAFEGSFAAEVFNNDLAAGAIVKQSNLGIGVVNAGDEIMISFAAKGEGAIGGVAFAEFFSELDGGGVSSAEILGGAPLGLTSDWQVFNFTAIAGPDVSGGVTLQFGAITGGAQGSVSVLFIDAVSVSVVPAPGALALLGMGGLAVTRRRR
jgi:MYXO-CTERM domain-containing protein